MDGVTPEDIIDLVVTSGSTTGVVNKINRVLSEESTDDNDSIVTSYTVSVDTATLPGATFTSLSTELINDVDSGLVLFSFWFVSCFYYEFRRI